ncbi:MAG TPA: flagellar hook-basal body complex protein [Aliidongia sp.]|uniref:flagellar hook protein FlgE n=1 Tax=Aliidongia sp. TaxID=1914230 RepID=UPI002DDCA814|nr:flagellar hook-basal body complex protein [Aliidongia sp.]HEV2678820.1 flagellar hook-basal body complex protein [Aliidongia sp.]
MSLFSSLTTAVSGLNAQQAAIGNISDNVANAQTVGFKRIDTGFENLVTESTQNFNEPGGVLAQPVYQNAIAGSLVQSQTATSLAITGQGFFQVKAPPSTAAGTATGTAFTQSNYYTRRGDFTVNKDGFLVNGAGYYLEGYDVNPQTNVVNNANGAAAPIQVTQLLDNPVATTNVTLAANLPSSYALQGTAGYSSPAPVTTQVYDALGNTHQASIQFDHTATNPNTWNASITLAGGNPGTADNYTLVFGDGSSSLAQLGDAAGGATIPPAGTLAYMTAAAANPDAGNAVSASGTNGAPATIAIPYNVGTTTNPVNLPITFNFGNYGTDTGVTQFADTQVNVSSITPNGIARGSYQSVSIDNNGNVQLNYSNGQHLTYFQIPIAQFNAPDQLQRLDGSAFSVTQGSGDAQLSAANANGAGSISPSTLEESNVDIASEFTKLITAQNVYSANSKVITTDNQLLQTIINVIQ